MSCRSSIRTASTTSTASGGSSSTSTAMRWGPKGLPQKGGGRETGGRIFVAEAWTPTVERTANYVRPDELHQAFNFQYLGTHWDAAELRTVIDRTLDAAPGRRPGHLGPVQPRRHPARHPLRQPARPRHPDPSGRRPRTGPARGPRGDPADAGAARLGLRLPGRGTGPAGRRRPAGRGAPGPGVLPGRRPGRLPRRLPSADPPGRARGRRTASATAAAGCRSRRAGAS